MKQLAGCVAVPQRVEKLAFVRKRNAKLTLQKEIEN